MQCYAIQERKENANKDDSLWRQQQFSCSVLKLINYSSADDPISLHQLGQVYVFRYPINIPILKAHSIGSKADQDTDQETYWILKVLILNTVYKPSENNAPNWIFRTMHFKILNNAVY